MNHPTDVLFSLPLINRVPSARLLTGGQVLLALLIAALLATV